MEAPGAEDLYALACPLLVAEHEYAIVSVAVVSMAIVSIAVVSVARC